MIKSNQFAQSLNDTEAKSSAVCVCYRDNRGYWVKWATRERVDTVYYYYILWGFLEKYYI